MPSPEDTPTLEAGPDEAALEQAAQQVSRWMARARDPLPTPTREAALTELISLHAVLLNAKPRAAQEAELAFLLLLEDAPAILDNKEYRRFIAEHIEPTDFFRIRWRSAEEVITIAEVLYGFHYQAELPAERVTSYVRELIRHAMRQFERKGNHEQMFELLQAAPLPRPLNDDELIRQAHRLQLFEIRQARRRRRLLRAFLVMQVLMITLVFPLLFLQLENGVTEPMVTSSLGAVLAAPPPRELSYLDAFYWSIITSASIGYGDITPITTAGKILATIVGTLGVLTAGVIAGLVLNWITPRELI